jgi:SAM-dependent methyltransferase
MDDDTSLRGTTIAVHPIRCGIGDHLFLANSWALPLPDNSCDGITCLDVLEYVRDDEAMICEFARVLQPGGRLQLRVPNAGPLAGLDSFNLYRYLVDIGHRGKKPVETDEVGWRRHYSASDLTTMLGPRFRMCAAITQRVGIAELLRTASLVLFRWALKTDAHERSVTRIIRLIERLEDRIKLRRTGAVLTLEAIRLPEPP